MTFSTKPTYSFTAYQLPAYGDYTLRVLLLYYIAMMAGIVLVTSFEDTARTSIQT
jgi:hypothetical protein